MTNYKNSLQGVPVWLLLLAGVVFVPAAMLFIVLIYLFCAFVGAPAVMLIWNYGLTTFLSAAGLGTVAKIGFWEAFRIGILGTWFTLLLRSFGQGFDAKKSD